MSSEPKYDVAASEARETESLIGVVVDRRYRILEPIGVGGMGTVYLAEHVKFGDRLAVKVLSHRFAFDPEWVQRFHLEARAAHRIEHEHIVRVVDLANPTPGLVYMVMELVSGESLSDLLRREGPLPWDRALRMGDQIASALEAAHAHGIVHRDIKPSNCIRTTRRGDPDFIKVLDFGIAKFLDAAKEGGEAPHTSTGVWMGTAEYMAPELFRGERADARVDVYALGVLLYKLITGRAPFRGGHMEVATQLALGDPPPPSRFAPPGAVFPPEVDALISRAIARELEDRFPSMAAMRAGIVAALAVAHGHAGGGDETTTVVVRTRTASIPAAPAPESVVEATMVHGRRPRPDESAVQPTQLAAVVTSRRRRPLAWIGGSLALGLLGVLSWSMRPEAEPTPEPTSPAHASGAADASSQPAEPAVRAAPSLLNLAPAEPGPSVTDPVAGDGSAPDAAGLPAGDATSGPAPSTAGKPKRDPRTKTVRESKKVEDPWEGLTASSLRAELETLRPKIRSTCFLPNRAGSGLKIELDIRVDSDGKATSTPVGSQHAHIADCVRLIIRTHKFPESRGGASLRHAFISG